ncbi:MAG: hypothetical protein ACJASQ_003044 [Crocinitomicaceae bacterium]|jgi:hypothetical protein
MDNILRLKTINELQDYSFFVPGYQRGYRWGKKEVIDLLNDISDFKPKEVVGKEEKTWYCLQPIVIKEKEDGQFEVIDGQQRLTTIYLILFYLNQRYNEENRSKLFELSYETRLASKTFLTTLTKDEVNVENVDFYHISSAYKAIYDWFSESKNFNINDFESKFQFNSKVIWYESIEQNSIDIFTRINIGKIPLTNAELIKALFLNRSNFDRKIEEKVRQKQMEISSEWDSIEHSLQENRFWFFLNGNNVSTNRIEFIFDLMNSELDKSDNYSTFRFFNNKFGSGAQTHIEENWLEIKTYHQRFTEWFEERDLYHKIGYLIATGAVTIKELYEESGQMKKSEFRKYLDEEIKRLLKKVVLEDLQYGDKQVKNILLLYNVLTMLNNENDTSYFPFEKYKKEKWDIEHITSISDPIPAMDSDWLNDAKVFIDLEKQEGKNLLKRADSFNFDDEEEFKELFKDLTDHFNQYMNGEDINDISNLSLLDSETNRGYKNAVFPLKRKIIIDREKQGTFIPIGTKNVFLKYFSDYPPKISFWTKEDREHYTKDLYNVLVPYLNKK